MFKRTLITAIAGLGATMSFATMNSAGAMTLAKPMFTDGPSSVLKVWEVLVNPQGSDDGSEYIVIKNTGPNSVELQDVHLIIIDGETSQDGEVDALVRLGDAGSGALNGSGSRVLASGACLLIRDTVSGSPLTISPTGGTQINVNFDASAFFDNGPIKNSGGLFALVGFSNPSSPGISVGSNLDANGNGTIDSAFWSTTYDYMAMRQAADQDTSSFYTTGIPNSTNGVKCAQQSNWTPDYLGRLKDDSTGAYDNALICDVLTKNGSNQINFSGSEITFGVDTGDNVPVTTSGTPRCTPGLSSQWSVTNGTTASVSYTH
jgi:hypothetical protein